MSRLVALEWWREQIGKVNRGARKGWAPAKAFGLFLKTVSGVKERRYNMWFLKMIGKMLRQLEHDERTRDAIRHMTECRRNVEMSM